MIISQFSLGDASIAQASPLTSSKKTPPKRQVKALSDRRLMPEPR